MTLRKERNFSIVMIIALVLSMILPSITLADTSETRTIGSLTIYKYEQDSIKSDNPAGDGTILDESNKPDGTPLDGVTYEIKQTHELKDIIEEDGTYSQRWSSVPEGTNEYSQKTKDGGKAVFEDLPLGRYTVQEVDGPSGVLLNKEVFTVDIPMTSSNGEDLNYDVHIYPKNETIKGKDEFSKVGREGSADHVLPGVKFDLFKVVEDGADKKISDNPLVTDINGKQGFKDLVVGKYYFKEFDSVNHYVLNDSKIEFEITKEDVIDKNDKVIGEATVVKWEPVPGFVEVDKDSGEVRVINYKEPAIVKTIEDDQKKFDRGQEFEYKFTVTLPKDIESYQTFTITDNLSEHLTYIVDSESSEHFEFDYNESEHKLTWSIKDFDQFNGGEIEISFKAKINKDAPAEAINNKAIIDYDNNRGGTPENPPSSEVPVKPTEGKLKVIKVSKDKDDEEENGDKKLLSGAVFKITTDKEGNDVVKTDGTVIKVDDENHKGNLENLVTNDNGEILIEGLTPGTYYLHETQAPISEDGTPYRLLTKPIKVEVKDGVVESYTVENSKSGWNLPTTGGIGTILFTVVGLGFMGIALFMLFRRKKEEA